MKLKSLVLAAALVPVCVYADWQPYVGIGGGIQNLKLSSQLNNVINYTTYTPANDQLIYPTYFTSNARGATLNFFGGLGNSYANNLYFGLELNASYNNSTGNSSTNIYSADALPALQDREQITSHMRWLFGLNGILGYQINSNWMPYLTAGVSTGRLQATYNVTQTFPGLDSVNVASIATGGQVYGINLGLGSRYYFNQHWFIKAEADYAYFLNVNTTEPVTGINGVPIAGTQPYSFNFSPQLWSANIGLGYQF